MSVIYERHQTRDFSVSGRTIRLTREWFVAVANTPDEEVTVLNLVLLANPLFYDGLVRSGADPKNQGGGNWYVSVQYENIDPQHALPDSAGPGGGGSQQTATAPTDAENLSEGFTFDVTVQPVHVTQSLGTIYSNGDDGETTEADALAAGWTLDNQRAVGLTLDGHVEGVDILSMRPDWTREVVREEVRLPYLRQLKALAGCFSIASFYGFAPYEVLYMGAHGRKNGGRWYVQHQFASGQVQTGVDIGGITIPTLRPFDYFWVRYKSQLVGDVVLPVPAQVYVERVYKPGDLDLLEIT